jgi:Zn-finger nucleic acid-binding protein
MANPGQGMPCPVDGTALVMSERSGIEIDYCPTCRGVWLDRGELDKIIERNAQQTAPAPTPAAVPQPPPPQGSPWGGAPQAPGQNYGYGKDQRQYGHHGKRKKSFLEELFD